MRKIFKERFKRTDRAHRMTDRNRELVPDSWSLVRLRKSQSLKTESKTRNLRSMFTELSVTVVDVRVGISSIFVCIY